MLAPGGSRRVRPGARARETARRGKHAGGCTLPGPGPPALPPPGSPCPPPPAAPDGRGPAAAPRGTTRALTDGAGRAGGGAGPGRRGRAGADGAGGEVRPGGPPPGAGPERPPRPAPAARVWARLAAPLPPLADPRGRRLGLRVRGRGGARRRARARRGGGGGWRLGPAGLRAPLHAEISGFPSRAGRAHFLIPAGPPLAAGPAGPEPRGTPLARLLLRPGLGSPRAWREFLGAPAPGREAGLRDSGCGTRVPDGGQRRVGGALQTGGEEGLPWEVEDRGGGCCRLITSLRPPHAPRMAATPESLFPSGGDLDSSQLHMEPDELDTLREGEDPGAQGARPSGRRGAESSGVHTLTLSLLLADRMHPFLAIYDLQPLKMHPLVFAPGVPVTAQVVGTERYTSGSKVAGRALGSWAEGGLRPSEGTATQPLAPPGGNVHLVFCPLDTWRLYLDHQEEVPSFPGAAPGPPETQSLDESASPGAVRGPVCFPSRARAPTLGPHGLPLPQPPRPHLLLSQLLSCPSSGHGPPSPDPGCQETFPAQLSLSVVLCQ